MEIIYPEIALKQPKADPRTVLLHKRNFLESSSDHMQDLYGNTQDNKTLIANCDISQNKICKYTTRTLTTTTKTATIKNSLKSTSPALTSLLLLSSSSSSTLSLLYSNLVNFSKSCHFKNSFHNYLYKIQKTKLIFFLLFICCAIFLQTTQAVPIRRVSTSGRKLILHTNIYRERYHQKLLEEQRQYRQQQLQIQQQLKEELQRQLQLQKLQKQKEHQQHHLETQSQTYFHHQHLQEQKQQQKQQQQQQLQVQRNHIFSPVHHTSRYPQQQPNHLHHLHQRAAPLTSATVHYHKLQQYKMSSCNSKSIYSNLQNQMNASMEHIKQLCTPYLRERNNETYESMSLLWRQSSLQIRNPNRQPATFIDNELHKEIYEFYINLHNFDKLLEHAVNDTKDNGGSINHSEQMSYDAIMKFFNQVRSQIGFSKLEAEKLMQDLQIAKPDLSEHQIEFDQSLGRRIRDFLIIKNIIDEFERVLQLVQTYCEHNTNE